MAARDLCCHLLFQKYLYLDVDFIFIHQEANTPNQEHVGNRKQEGSVFRF